MKYFIVIVIIGLLFYGCEKPPTYSDVPIITFKSMTPNIVRSISDSSADAQGLADTVQIQVNFTDGNGAIGIPETDSTDYDAFLIDSRKTNNSNLTIDTFRIPYITPNGNVKAISGTISFTVYDILARQDPAHSAWDTLQYTVTIRDRNGNVSNPVKTPNLYIKNN